MVLLVLILHCVKYNIKTLIPLVLSWVPVITMTANTLHASNLHKYKNTNDNILQ